MSRARGKWRQTRAWAGALLASASLQAQAKAVAPNEEVIFFPTVATWNPAAKNWSAEVRGWVFEPEENSVSRKLMLKVLRRTLGFSEREARSVLFQRRARRFLVDNTKRRLQVELNGQTYALKRSDAGGHFSGQLEVPRLPKDQWTTYRIPAIADDARVFSGKIWAASDRGLLVISDIDDTIKLTNVLQRRTMLGNTFLKKYVALPGMARWYARWAKENPGALFYYVSASPWQLYPELLGFLADQGFPEGILELKRFRFKDRTFFSLFKDPETFKRPILEEIITRFPRRKLILVGDAGEKDPEIYGAIARRYPKQIQKIYIRYPDAPPSEQRLQAAFRDVPRAQWTLFQEAKGV